MGFAARADTVSSLPARAMGGSAASRWHTK